MRLMIALGSLLLAAAAQAGDPSAAAKPCRHSVDADGDGVVTREEATAHPRLSEGFDTWDRNGDGQLDSAEMKVHHEAMHGEMRAKRHERWTAADTDGDGAIDLAEAQVGLPGLASQFSTVDADGDGKVTPGEMRAARKSR